jgi:predicted membrane GTPase involved in stress response
MNFVDKPNLEPSDKIKQLYDLLQELNKNEDYSNFYYYRYLVQQGQKDCMVVLMNQLEDMFKLYNIK